MIDRAQTEQAKELLEMLYQEFEDCLPEEVELDIDTRVLVMSLLGLLKKSTESKTGGIHKEQIEGLKLAERATEMSSDIPGGQ